MNSENNPTVAVPVNNNIEIPDNNVQRLNVVHSIYTPYTNENEYIKTIIHSRARIVKYLIIIDILFLFINLGISIANKDSLWFMTIFLPLCFCGFYGVTYFKKYYLIAYNFYLLLMCMYYFSLTILFYNFLFLLIFGIELYFLIYSTRLFYYMNEASSNVIQSLREGWTPTEYTTYYY